MARFPLERSGRGNLEEGVPTDAQTFPLPTATQPPTTPRAEHPGLSSAMRREITRNGRREDAKNAEVEPTVVREQPLTPTLCPSSGTGTLRCSPACESTGIKPLTPTLSPRRGEGH
ncbi:MAG: hypothetical protein AMXMBFR61_14230 [Fimbriimonadales bacterium]